MGLGWPLLVVYGVTCPRQADLSALHLSPGEVPLLISLASGSDICTGDGACTLTQPQRTYIVLPRAFRDGAVSVVREANPASVYEEHGLALVFFAVERLPIRALALLVGAIRTEALARCRLTARGGAVQ